MVSLLNFYASVRLLSISLHLHRGAHACKIQRCADDSARRVPSRDAKGRDRFERP
jgi:hypothetical protein